MSNKKFIAFTVILILAAAITASAFPLRRGTPSKRFVPLKSEGEANGEVTLESSGSHMPEQVVLGIHAYRLKPNSTYSVWFVNEGKTGERIAMDPVGDGDNFFRTAQTTGVT